MKRLAHREKRVRNTVCKTGNRVHITLGSKRGAGSRGVLFYGYIAEPAELARVLRFSLSAGVMFSEEGLRMAVLW